MFGGERLHFAAMCFCVRILKPPLCCLALLPLQRREGGREGRKRGIESWRGERERERERRKGRREKESDGSGSSAVRAHIRGIRERGMEGGKSQEKTRRWTEEERWREQIERRIML